MNTRQANSTMAKKSAFVMELLANPGCTESFCIRGHHFLKVDMMPQYTAQAAVLCLARIYISSCSAVNKSHPIFLIYFGSHYLQVHLHANILNNPIDSPPPHSLPSLFSTYWCFGPRPLPYPLRLVLYRVKSGGKGQWQLAFCRLTGAERPRPLVLHWGISRSWLRLHWWEITNWKGGR